MNKAFKITISALLALVIVFGTTASAFAAGAEHCEKAPIVFVPGIGDTLILTNDDGSTEAVFPPSGDALKNAVLKMAPFIPLAMLFGSWDVFGDALSVASCDLFDKIKCDEQGNSVYNVASIPSEVPTAQTHTQGDNTYDFHYDWRLDPVDNAARLDSYIAEVLEVSGHDKVILEGYSEGGEVTLAYLSTYGNEKVEKYIAMCSAFQGLSLVGRVFSGEAEFNGKQLYNFLSTMLPPLGADSSVMNLLSVLRYTGAYNIISVVLNNFIGSYFPEFYDKFARPYFGSMPGVFCFTPADYFDGTVSKMFGTSAKYSVMVERLTRYHNIQLNAKKTLQALVDDGMSIAIISNYNCYPMPFVGSDIYQSDSLIDAKNSSGGATFAPMGSTFAAGYTQKITDGHNHLSPDGMVDASTCMFPDYTWFISGYTHWNSPDDICQWAEDFDGQPTVFSSTAYPQFLVGNTQTKTVSPQK